jgi:hypothetical protein
MKDTKGFYTMEVTQDMINALLMLGDAELSQKFTQIAAALGMNEKTAQANTAKFRGMLTKSSPADLNRLLETLGKERTAEILKTLDGESS